MTTIKYYGFQNYKADFSIKHRIILINTLTTTAILIIATIFLAIKHNASLKQHMLNKAKLQASILLDNSLGPLLFDSPEILQGLFNGLDKHSNINVAAIIDDQSEVQQAFMVYSKHQQALKLPKITHETIDINEHRVLIIKAVTYDKEIYGWVYLESNLEELDQQIQDYITSILYASILFIIVVFLLSFYLQKIVVQPIITIAEQIKTIASNDSYQQIPIERKDELEIIIQSFNQMLMALNEKEKINQRHKNHLNDLVKEKTKESEENHEKLLTVINSLDNALLVTDINNNILQYNQALLSMFDLPIRPENLTVSPLISALLPLIQKSQTNFEQSFVQNINLAKQRKGKAISKAIIYQQQWIGTVTLIHDITYEVKLDQMKSDFLSIASHEMKTPLTTILGFSEKNDEKLTKIVEQYPELKTKFKFVLKNSRTIQLEGNRLRQLVDDLLDASKLESNAVDWQLQPHSIVDIVKRTADSFAPQFEHHHIKWQLQLSPNIPTKIKLDAKKIEQVVANLLSNAVKFSPEHGQIIGKIEHNDEYVTVSIKDQGPGIAKADRERVFARFQRLRHSKNKPGHGLGLWICQEIIQHHQGTLKVTTPPQQTVGSQFSFTLPIQRKS